MILFLGGGLLFLLCFGGGGGGGVLVDYQLSKGSTNQSHTHNQANDTFLVTYHSVTLI